MVGCLPKEMHQRDHPLSKTFGLERGFFFLHQINLVPCVDCELGLRKEKPPTKPGVCEVRDQDPVSPRMLVHASKIACRSAALPKSSSVMRRPSLKAFWLSRPIAISKR